MLQARDSMPHFEVTGLDGAPVRYTTIWQHRNLVLVSLPESPTAGERHYASRLTRRIAEEAGHDTDCVITTDGIAGVPAPGVIVADRWGEISFVASAGSLADLPSAEEIVEWLRFTRFRCPECEGEWR